MSGELAFNAAFMYAAAMPLPQRARARRPTGAQTRRSNSTSRADYPGARRAFGRSRPSSSSQTSGSSHETETAQTSQTAATSLQTDRPATTSAAAAAAAGRKPAAAADSPNRAVHAVASVKSPSSMHRPPRADDLHGFDSLTQMNAHDAGAESVSSASGTASLSARTVMTSDPSATGDHPLASRPFILRNGRTYLNDPTLPYPIPSDLTELHRQSLRTLLLIQLFGAPVCSPSLTKRPPQRVLEIGCGSGFWSMMCHRYFKGRGHGGISFIGIDIAPLSPGSASMPADAAKPDQDMKWKFVNHDLRQMPWPLPAEEFDLIMVKDMSLAMTNTEHQDYVDEFLRLLGPGGTLEIWESDHLIRMLRPHVPGSAQTGDADEQEAAASLGAYIMSSNTPLSAPLNTFLQEYNNWLTRALEARDVSAVPCTLIGPVLLQESEILADVRSRRLAVPLSEVRWEHEGLGAVVTRDGRSNVDTKGKDVSSSKMEHKTLTAGQHALRKTALLTVVQQVQALEPILREVSGKSQDEWDVWLGKMMSDLMGEGGASWGECLEVGAWWAKKRKNVQDG
ncbi:hypothetical protein TOPH_07935 [Tolypocladium ophioglossoides CBS 100239]|uniref:Methyltransferase domain-containing protein n=1 Tax=Tolypocladium ophioglossoides (strain CBS 100239) TaxID=1163406 RepID=A0A0L0N031_TOLOC|nr:hypothetical protein TOPH_07935 [Tolypocladium ophioglossoides CBS 100239]